MKGWRITAALLLSLVAILVAPPTQADPEANAWTEYHIPEKGSAGDWVLTSSLPSEETGVTAICVASDGTIYAATEEISGSPLKGYNLFKSTDDGYTWMPLWRIPDGDNPNGGEDSKITAIILPQGEDDSTLYLITQYNIYKSDDGGETFAVRSQLPSAPDTLVTSLDVIAYEDTRLIVAGTRHADPGSYGGVYFYDESQPWSPWTDLRVGNSDAGTRYDVLAVAFSPNFADDHQIIAVVTDEVNTIVTTKLGIADWGTTIGDAVIPSLVATGGSLAFPADYDSDVLEEDCVHYVGIDAGGVVGGVFMITGLEAPDNSLAAPLFAPAPVHSLAAAGEILGPTIVAGLTNGGVFYVAATTFSDDFGDFDSGLANAPPSAPPASNTCVAIGTFHGTDYFVYAGTSGVNGGFARSVNSGASFARTGLICDDLETIIDLAVSPKYTTDETVYMITVGSSGNSILWRTADEGKTWDAVLTSTQEEPPSDTLIPESNFDKVALSSNFASDTTAFICEEGAAPIIWRTTDNGFSFSPLRSRAGTTGTIDSWATIDNRTLAIGDSLGDFYKTANGGVTWSTAVATGIGASVESMSLSPDYDNDDTILVGGASTVYISTDDGETWQQATTSAIDIAGTISVAFDPYYPSNDTIYAAGAAAGDGIRRLVIDSNTKWQRIDNVNPSRPEETPTISTLVVGDDGNSLSTIYGTDPSPVVTRVVTDGGGTAAIGGIARCLNPTAPLSPADDAPLFELVNHDLPTSATMNGLWLAEDTTSRRLWSYDSSVIPNVLYTYEDTFILPPELISPADGTSSGRQISGEVSWDSIGASSYEVWYDIVPSFKQSPMQIYSERTTANITLLESGMTYYWRVRVGQSGGSTLLPGTTITFGDPVLSRFSQTWSFTTALGQAQWSPATAPAGLSPSPGATSVPLRPTFAWHPADWATGYEFILARDSGFADAIISITGVNALNTTVWAYDRELEYNTTYFWKIRAISPTSHSEWAVGIFTTEAVSTPVTPPPAPPPATPAPTSIPVNLAFIWAIIGIGATLVIGLLVLIVKTS